jgi:hypothetical protein
MKFSSIIAAAFAGSPALAVPAGFVTTDGTKFSLDGKDFFFAGSNAYYLPFNIVCSMPSNVETRTDSRSGEQTITRMSSLAWKLPKTLV